MRSHDPMSHITSVHNKCQKRRSVNMTQRTRFCLNWMAHFSGVNAKDLKLFAKTFRNKRNEELILPDRSYCNLVADYLRHYCHSLCLLQIMALIFAYNDYE